MAVRLNNGFGRAALLAVLIVPGILAAYLLHAAVWAVIVPVATVVLMLIIAALPSKRRVTQEKFGGLHTIVTQGNKGSFRTPCI